jgi:hypothetical protein
MNLTFIPPVQYLKGDYYEAKRLGFSGRNTSYNIKIVTGSSIYIMPILAQERAEWGYKTKIGLVAGAALGLGAYLLGAHWAVAALIAFAGLVLAYKPFSRNLEYLGQTVELVVATEWFGADRDDYFLKTAQQLTGYAQFKGVSVNDIENNLRKAEPKARKWVASHKKLLEHYENKLKTFPDYKGVR